MLTTWNNEYYKAAVAHVLSLYVLVSLIFCGVAMSQSVAEHHKNGCNLPTHAAG